MEVLWGEEERVRDSDGGSGKESRRAAEMVIADMSFSEDIAGSWEEKETFFFGLC
jgi:hypothetical protein